jgi:hypothetical protein
LADPLPTQPLVKAYSADVLGHYVEDQAHVALSGVVHGCSHQRFTHGAPTGFAYDVETRENTDVSVFAATSRKPERDGVLSTWVQDCYMSHDPLVDLCDPGLRSGR